MKKKSVSLLLATAVAAGAGWRYSRRSAALLLSPIEKRSLHDAPNDGRQAPSIDLQKLGLDPDAAAPVAAPPPIDPPRPPGPPSRAFVLEQPGTDFVGATLFDSADAMPASAGLGSWEQCRNPKYHRLPVQLDKQDDGTRYLTKECQPDTLYSWGDSMKLLSFMQCASDSCRVRNNGAWSDVFPTAIFSHINPLATFGYGDIMFRMKLKTGTKFKFISNPKDSSFCDKYLAGAERNDTVLVRYYSVASSDVGIAGMEYILCGTGPIDSWSVGTAKAYDEIINSQIWNNNNQNNWLFYIENNDTPMLYDASLDGRDWRKEHLQRNLKAMRAMINEHLGGIYFSPGAPQDPAEHFRTSRKVYWNWRD